jgi:hypothetical protein
MQIQNSSHPQAPVAYGRAGKQTGKFGIKHFRVLTVNRECASSRKTLRKPRDAARGFSYFN